MSTMTYIDNSTATYSCNAGYTLTVADDKRTCLESGLWSGSEPTCTSKHKPLTMNLTL